MTRVRSLAALCAAAAMAGVLGWAPAASATEALPAPAGSARPALAQTASARPALVSPAQTASARPARASPAPALSVRAAVLIDESSGRELYAVNGNEELPIASTTKLMTALVTLERDRQLSRTLTQNHYYPAAADSQIGLVPGERMSVHDLMLALLLPSADDAAEDLAYNIGGRSVPSFIAMMNVRARQLGLLHTHYSTPVGFDTPGNYSSASDLVKLARFLLTHYPFFVHAVDLSRAVLFTGRTVRHVVNTDDLVGRVPWINGVKTGHTAGAGYVLVGSGTRDGMTLLSVVLGTTSESARDANTLSLLRWGFASFRGVRPVVAGQVLARLAVRGEQHVQVGVIAARTVTEVIPKRARVTLRLELPRQLTAPRARRAVVGTAVVLAGGAAVARVPLLLEQSVAVPPASATMLITRPFTLVPLVLLLAAGAWFVLRRRERTRRNDAAGPETA